MESYIVSKDSEQVRQNGRQSKRRKDDRQNVDSKRPKLETGGSIVDHRYSQLALYSDDIYKG